MKKMIIAALMLFIAVFITRAEEKKSETDTKKYASGCPYLQKQADSGKSLYCPSIKKESTLNPCPFSGKSKQPEGSIKRGECPYSIDKSSGTDCPYSGGKNKNSNKLPKVIDSDFRKI
ncbi:MAG: hypothetical protein K9I69_06815 [Ignavibacteriales bacterium]|nr:hypothetical protein [Ignavibacteriales bacterium]MCF8305629.1 hypothetical protein [Ignavibacteriales bacterium]MCF8315351.1 hypothetical protein [Ignavibacteriales bacterium]MCF8436757.1 hypothetical protein [Ignavibacteriales bacterium]